MQQVIKQLLKGKLPLVLSLIITIGIVYLSLNKPSQHSSIHIKHLDKIQHCFAYFIFAITWLITAHNKNIKNYVLIIFCISFGILLEFLQEILTDYRTGDLLDVLANSTGVLLGLLFFDKIFKKKWLN